MGATLPDCPQPAANKEKSSRFCSPLIHLSVHGELILQTNSQLAQPQDREREGRFRKSGTILPCSACGHSRGGIAPSHCDAKGLHPRQRHAARCPTHFRKQLIIPLSPKNLLLSCSCWALHCPWSNHHLLGRHIGISEVNHCWWISDSNPGVSHLSSSLPVQR